MLRQECPGRKIDRIIVQGNILNVLAGTKTGTSQQEMLGECPGRNKESKFSTRIVTTRMSWQEQRQELRSRKRITKNDLAGKKTGTSQKQMVQQEYPGMNKDSNFARGI